MAVRDQLITPKFAIYNADCMAVMQDMPAASVHLSVYSPPFASAGVGGLYVYSSDPRDLSNCDSYDAFFEQYTHIVRELARVTVPGRMSCVHCMDIPRSNSGTDSYIDFPGDIIKPWVGGYLLLLGLLVGVAGQLGDLVLSAIKRDVGIKDFAATIPGHGGLLDRFDSLVLVAPAAFHLIGFGHGIGLGSAPRILTGG